MPTTYTFTASVTATSGSFSGDYLWTNASNWPPGVVPGVGDPDGDVVIAQTFPGSTPYTVALDNVDLGGAVLDFNTLSLTGADATLLVSGVTLDAKGGDLPGAAVITVGADTTIDMVAASDELQVPGLNYIELAGTIEGTGTILTSDANGNPNLIRGAGTVIAEGGTLDLATGIGGNSSGAVNFDVGTEAGSILQTGATVGTGTYFGFLSATTGELALGADLGTPALTVDNLGVATTSFLSSPTGTNFIDLLGQSGVMVENATFTSSTSGTVTLSDGITLDITGSGYAPGSTQGFAVSDGTGGTDIFLGVCFVAGTRIATERGEIAVERLATGDRVVVQEGESRVLRPVKWVGHRRLDLTAHPRPELAAPIRIRRHAIGPDQPRRDLLVSPDHCLFLDGKLIPAKLLLNGTTIIAERDLLSTVTYYHVELERHGILHAEGLATESYLDTGNRAFFSNAGLALILHPEFHVNAGLKCWETDACAPLAVSGAAVEDVWRRLAQRAETLGIPTPRFAGTADADIHLAVDGRSIRPVVVDSNRYSFLVPETSGTIRLVSRSGIPSEDDRFADDWRRLGVAVSRIVLRRGVEQVDIPADHPSLMQGWHATETDGRNVWRWTDGNALLCAGATRGPLVIEVHLGATRTYRLEGDPGWRRAA